MQGMKVLKRIKEAWRVFRQDTSGVSAIVFALSVPMILAAAGITVDIAQAYNAKSRLSNALDKSALAAATIVGTNEYVEDKIMSFLGANYPEGKLGGFFNVNVTIGESSVTVSAQTRVDLTFMAMFGQEYLDINASTTVQREFRGLEVVMVLDNSGSMGTNNNIQALRDASTNFVNILFDATQDPEDIKIGMVPYSSSVRIGRYGLGQFPDGSPYGTGYNFVTLPPGVSYTTDKNSSTGWYGCVEEHMSNNYDSAATHVTNSYGQLWKTSASCTTQSNCRGHGWDASANSNDPAPNDIPDDYAGPWDIYMYGTVSTNCGGTCNPKYSFNKHSRPNIYCPWAYVMPLSSDRNALLANVSTMQAEGATMSNSALAWGHRMLSPAEPFAEGVAWDDDEWRKAIVFMTDGQTSIGGNVTSYWFTSKNNISNASLDARLSSNCELLKDADHNTIIYTITFASGVSASTKQAYRDCATTDEHYFDAPAQQDLIDAFEEIARQLSMVRIVN